jgi:outer membrane protein
MTFSRFIIFIFCCFYVVGCSPLDPTCRDQTSLAPGKFWHPTEDHIEGYLDNDWPTETTTDLSALNRKDIQIVDLLDLALQLNPNTQLTWANARAAAYFVEVQRSALYPTVEILEEFNFSDVHYDDGNPLLDDMTTTTPALSTCEMIALMRALNCQGKSASFVPPPRLRGSGIIPNLLNTRSPNCEKTIKQVLATHQQNVVNSTNTGNVATGNTGNTAVAATAGQATNAVIANATAGQALGTGGIGSNRNLLHDLSVSYLLLDFGGRDASIEAARQALYNSDWVHNRQIQQVIIVVLRNYFNLVGTLSLIEARQSDLKNAQTNFESASQLFEAGIRNKLDVLQAQTDLINIQLTIIDLEQQKQVAYGNLANAIGLPAHIPFNIPEIPQDLLVDVSVGNIDELIQKAIKVRPDLAATYAEHERRRAEVIVARSQGLPTINTQFDLRSFNDLINPDFNTHAISGQCICQYSYF